MKKHLDVRTVCTHTRLLPATSLPRFPISPLFLFGRCFLVFDTQVFARLRAHLHLHENGLHTECSALLFRAHLASRSQANHSAPTSSASCGATRKGTSAGRERGHRRHLLQLLRRCLPGPQRAVSESEVPPSWPPSLRPTRKDPPAQQTRSRTTQQQPSTSSPIETCMDKLSGLGRKQVSTVS